MNGELGGCPIKFQLSSIQGVQKVQEHLDKRYQYYTMTKPVIISVVNFKGHEIFSPFWKGGEEEILALLMSTPILWNTYD